MTLELHYSQQLISFSAPLRDPSQCKNISLPLKLEPTYFSGGSSSCTTLSKLYQYNNLDIVRQTKELILGISSLYVNSSLSSTFIHVWKSCLCDPVSHPVWQFQWKLEQDFKTMITWRGELFQYCLFAIGSISLKLWKMPWACSTSLFHVCFMFSVMKARRAWQTVSTNLAILLSPYTE